MSEPIVVIPDPTQAKIKELEDRVQELECRVNTLANEARIYIEGLCVDLATLRDKLQKHRR